MAVTQHYTQEDILRILGITRRQLSRWESLRLVPPPVASDKPYTFADLISLKTIKKLRDQGVGAVNLARAVEALREDLGPGETPWTEFRFRPQGRRLMVEHAGCAMDPLSGQLLLNFEESELAGNVRAMPARSAEEWAALAQDCEANLKLHPELCQQAIEAYHQVIREAPNWFAPHVNLGILLFEQGELLEAAAQFRCATDLAPGSALAHFNLGSVLDELKHLDEARHHLREAVRLEPDYADAHYNLARVCEQMGELTEARAHWRRYLQLDPHSRWAEYARQRLEAGG
jgi:tetratricopeptide (TPR) repeat protein